MKVVVATFVALLAVGCASTSRQPLTPYDIVINHSSGVMSPVGLLKKRPGEIVKVQIRETNLDCFIFNPTVTEQAQEQRRSARSARREAKTTEEFEVLYDGVPLELTIEAVKKPNVSGCANLVEFKQGGDRPPWKILIKTDGWDLAFAGAFTADGLTNPEFEAVPATRTKMDGTTETGVTLREVERGRDEARLGAAATVHLYHTDPERIGMWSVNWVPVSFGLGIGENSQTRYYLGTGLKFDRKLFLTVGMAIGSVNYMPTGLDANNFTTNTNILSLIPSRTERTWFAGISYSFAGVGPDAFRGPFSAVKPAPAGGQSTGDTGSGDDKAEAKVEVSVTTAGANAKYSFDVSNVGEADGEFKIAHKAPTGLTIATWKCTATSGGCPNPAAGTGDISATVTFDVGKKLTFEVATTGTPTANGTVTVTVDSTAPVSQAVKVLPQQ